MMPPSLSLNCSGWHEASWILICWQISVQDPDSVIAEIAKWGSCVVPCWYHDWYGYSASFIIGLHPSSTSLGLRLGTQPRRNIAGCVLLFHSWLPWIHIYTSDVCTFLLICWSWILILDMLQSLTLRHAKYRSHHSSNYCHLHQDDLSQDSLHATLVQIVSSSCPSLPLKHLQWAHLHKPNP